MTKVLVPNHIAEEKEKEQESAYIDAEKRVLDPELLNKSLLERMPQPTGWRILILPYKGKGVSEGGIHLVQQTVDRESLATVVGYVLKMGPDCYKDASRFSEPWCEEKQWVLIGRYAGARFKLGDDAECRIINDDEVIATILDPEDIIAV